MSGRRLVVQWLKNTAVTLRGWVRDNVFGLFDSDSKGQARTLAATATKFVVFLVPGRDFVNGGVMSVFSIAKESQNLLSKDFVVAICTAPGEKRIRRYTKFDNSFELLAFIDLVQRIPFGSSILLHAPEVLSARYFSACLWVARSRSDLTWHFNVLLQNIDLVPAKSDLDRLSMHGSVSLTTSHKAYETDAAVLRLGYPVHFMSAWVCPEEYERVELSHKEKLLILSPDDHARRNDITAVLHKALPDFEIVVIHDMTYAQYRDCIRRAKLSFTFGEGLDGYFIETIFSGGVGMAVYNEKFFTSEYRDLPGVFRELDILFDELPAFLAKLRDDAYFMKVFERQFAVGARNYVGAEYRANVRNFYVRTGWIAASQALLGCD